MHDAIVYVVDDDPSLRRALERLLRARGYTVRSFPSAEEFLQHRRGEQPACLVTDIKMPAMSGLDLQEALRAGAPSIPLIFITGYGDIPTSVRAMKHGAVNFLTKPLEEADLVGAIDDAIRKDRDDRQERRGLDDIRLRLGSLTAREREVLSFVVRGLRNKGIAWELGICEKTVKLHRSRVMSKMKVRSVAELVSTMHRADPGLAGGGSTSAVRSR